MAEYYPLLARAVERLPESTAELRQSVYERARAALIGQLRKTEPPVPEGDIARESEALDAAIARLERELGARRTTAAALPPSVAVSTPTAASPNAPVTSPPVTPFPSAPKLPGLAPRAVRPPAVSVPLPPLAATAPAMPAPPASLAGTAPAAASGGSPAAAPMVAPGVDAPPSGGRVLRPPAMTSPASEAAWPPAPKLDLPRARGIAPTEPALTPPRGEQTEPVHTPFWQRFGRSKASAGQAASLAMGSRRGDLAGTARATQKPPLAPLATLSPVEAPAVAAVRPQAPPKEVVQRASRGVGVGLFGLLVAMVAVGVLAYRLRDKPEDFARIKSPVTEDAAATPAPKIVERFDGRRPGAASAPASNSPAADAQQATVAPQARSEPQTIVSPLPVGQRAALLVEAPDEAQRVKTYFGAVVWKLERSSPEALPVLRADVNLPDARLDATMLISRNIDPNAIASHVITLRFAPGVDSAISSVTEIEAPSMRQEERPVGEALEGRAAPVQANYFFVGLIRDATMTAHNLELLKTRAWIDVPMRLSSGKIAKLTFEKGALGDRLLDQALEAWK